MDNSITFRTDLDNSQLEKEYTKTVKKIEGMEKDLSAKKAGGSALEESLIAANQRLDEAKVKLSELRREQEKTAAALDPVTGRDPAAFIEAYAAKPGIDKAVAAQEKEVASLQSEYDKLNSRVQKYSQEISKATDALNAQKTKAAELSDTFNQPSGSAGTVMQEAFNKAENSAEKFGNRLKSLAARAIVFNVISSGLRAVVGYMGDVLQCNDEYSTQLAKLKGALLTAFQPIYEYVLPGLIAVLRVLTSIVQVAANVLSALFGKSASQSAENAESLYNEANAIESVGSAAKKARKDLAGFDEINRLGGDDDAGGGASVGASEPDFSDFNADEYKSQIDELTVYLSGALLALGAILAFSGANIPLGIALMAAGAIGLAAEIKENWGTMSDELQGAITNVLTILGGAALVIGAILTFSGANVPAGIALMLLGAVSMAGSVAVNWKYITNNIDGVLATVELLLGGAVLALGAVLAFSGANIPLGIAMIAGGAYAIHESVDLNWESISQALEGPIGKITAAVSAALLVIGAVLAFTGANLPLGIALIGAGAAGLITVAAVNWNVILEKLQGAWGGISQWFNTTVKPKLTLDYWKEKFANIGDGLKQALKNGVNSAIGVLNSFIDFLNDTLSFNVPAITIAGQKIFSGTTLTLAHLDHIPKLAQGAVIPPNREFLAVLGDQKHGTNVEAPLETIQEAVAVVMEDMVGGMMAGFEALLEENRLLREVVEEKEIGDEAVYRANKRYTEKINTIRGRA